MVLSRNRKDFYKYGKYFVLLSKVNVFSKPASQLGFIYPISKFEVPWRSRNTQGNLNFLCK